MVQPWSFLMTRNQSYNGGFDNLETDTCPISNGNPDIVIDTDASLTVWGAVCNRVTAQGSFTPLVPSVFELITMKLGQPEIELFASYSNDEVACYYSWQPDPGAAHVDAFTVSLSGPLTSCFPPFSLLGRCLQKNGMDQAECIVLTPNWRTQPCYSKVMEMLVSLPLVLPCQPQLLQFPHDPHRRHPLFLKLQLLACKLSGNPLRVKTFQDTLPTLSSYLGAQEHRSSIKLISTSGLTTVVKGKLIHFIPL